MPVISNPRRDEHLRREIDSLILDVRRVSARLDWLTPKLLSRWHRGALTREHPENLEKLAQDLETLRDSFLRHAEETGRD